MLHHKLIRMPEASMTWNLLFWWGLWIWWSILICPLRFCLSGSVDPCLCLGWIIKGCWMVWWCCLFGVMVLQILFSKGCVCLVSGALWAHDVYALWVCLSVNHCYYNCAMSLHCHCRGSLASKCSYMIWNWCWIFSFEKITSGCGVVKLFFSALRWMIVDCRVWIQDPRNRRLSASSIAERSCTNIRRWEYDLSAYHGPSYFFLYRSLV